MMKNHNLLRHELGHCLGAFVAGANCCIVSMHEDGKEMTTWPIWDTSPDSTRLQEISCLIGGFQFSGDLDLT